MNPAIFIVMLLSEFCEVIAQICYKSGVNLSQTKSLRGVKGYIIFSLKVLAAPSIWLGFALMLGGMVLWLFVLDRFNLSFAFPFQSIQYLMVPVASVILLKEKINKDRIFGVILVVLGIIIVTVS